MGLKIDMTERVKKILTFQVHLNKAMMYKASPNAKNHK
jgi:hypothetical protein